MNIDKSLPWTARAAGPSEGAGPSEVAVPREAAGRRDAADTFEPAVAPHYAPLVRRLALVLGDEAEAEDAAQEAYLQAFRSWSRFDGADVRAWLYTIGLRLAFNELRRRRRRLTAVGRLRPPAAATVARHHRPRSGGGPAIARAADPSRPPAEHRRRLHAA